MTTNSNNPSLHSGLFADIATSLCKSANHCNSIKPVFTRYLYEFHHVKYSLQWALMEKKREEALYWAYELYHSGFQTEIWHWIRELYVKYYEEHNPRFKAHLDRLYLQWKETGNVCLLGTAVGTLALRDTQGGGKGERFIILYKEDRHQTQEISGKARNYLKQVTQYPIRPQAKYMAQILPTSSIQKLYSASLGESSNSSRFASGVQRSFDGLALSRVREAYLGPNWAYYCAETPIWRQRIQEGRGKIADGKTEIAFETDDDLEAFYEKWGLEPDEQSLEMHHWHGIYSDSRICEASSDIRK